MSKNYFNYLKIKEFIDTFAGNTYSVVFMFAY